VGLAVLALVVVLTAIIPVRVSIVEASLSCLSLSSSDTNSMARRLIESHLGEVVPAAERQVPAMVVTSEGGQVLWLRVWVSGILGLLLNGVDELEFTSMVVVHDGSDESGDSPARHLSYLVLMPK
jgi:hypothetical protein